jgi:AcrR family transcriptional regulator
MRRSAEATRAKILESAYSLFYARGYARVGVDEIAAAAGITKRTLYAHFDSKDALIAAVLERQHALALATIERWAASLDGGRPEAIDAVFAEIAEWAATPRWSGPGFTRITMELADLPGHPARAITRRHKRAVEDRLARALGSRETAIELVLLIEGAMVLLLVHGERRYAEAAAAAARRLVAPAR